MQFTPFSKSARSNGAADSAAHSVDPGEVEKPLDVFSEVGKYAPPDTGEVEAPDAGDGVYAIIKNTNFWFNRELYQIEQQARADAAGWAEKGLPHHATPLTEALPVEQALVARCTETLQEWSERVRTKMQDTIEKAGQAVAERIVQLRFTLKQLETTELELRNKEREAEDLRESLRERLTPFGYKPLVGSVWAYSILTLLVIVEFIANFPVFRILLPMNASLATIAERVSRRSIDKGLLTGPYHLIQDLLLRPEALAVSFVVVIVLIVLGDFFGESARPLAALSAKDNPAAAVGIRRHKAQHWLRLSIALAGTILALTFLYQARARIPQTAISRVAADSSQLADVDRQLVAAAKTAAVGELTIRRDDADRRLQLRREEAAYAQTVQSSNLAILLLNIALLLAAAAVGYSKKGENLTDELSEDPRYVDVRNTINRLRVDALGHRQAVRDAAAEVRVGISRVQHLLAAQPLKEWKAKEDRLNGVIPLFRAENARLRSLDPREILAFQKDFNPGFAPIDESDFRPPTGFDRYEAEFAELNATFAEISRRLESTDDKERAA